MAIDTWNDSSTDAYYLHTWDKQKLKDDNDEKLFEAGFEKLSCTNDDFYSDVNNEWIGEELQNIVKEFSSSFHTTSIEKKGDLGTVKSHVLLEELELFNV